MLSNNKVNIFQQAPWEGILDTVMPLEAQGKRSHGQLSIPERMEQSLQFNSKYTFLKHYTNSKGDKKMKKKIHHLCLGEDAARLSAQSSDTGK